MSFETKVFHADVWTVVALVRNGRALASDYIAALPTPAREKVLKLIVRVASYGPPANIQQNRKLDADIWELKSGQTMLLYFIEGPWVIVLTHGFAKKQQKLPRRELDHARRLMVEYLDSH